MNQNKTSEDVKASSQSQKISIEDEHLEVSKKIRRVLNVSYLVRSGEKVNFQSRHLDLLSKQEGFYLTVVEDIDNLIFRIKNNIPQQSFFKKRKSKKIIVNLTEAKTDLLKEQTRSVES